MQQITLDLHVNKIVCINAKQGDMQSRQVTITITDNGKDFLLNKNTMSVVLRGRKPDKNNILNDAIITDDGKVLIELDEQILAEFGKCQMDLVIFESVQPLDIDSPINNSVLSTMIFYVNVIQTPIDTNEVISSNEFKTLNNGIAELKRVTQESLDTMDSIERMANNKMNEMDAKIPTKLSQLQNDKNFLTAKDGQKSGTSMGEKSVAFGSNNEITGEGAFVHGENCIASGKMSYAGGGACRAIGEYSHGEGCNDPYYNEPVIAEGIGSHAEGRGTRATNSSSHAEGEKTLSSGNAGHAEGKYSEASGEGAHSENISTMASGFASHAEGENTVANGLCQHVQGKYNISDPNKAHIVGGGTSNIDRKNIHTLDWQGNAEFAGDVVANGCNSGEDPVSLIELSNKIKDLTVTAPQTQVVWEGALYFNTNDTIYFKIPKTHIHNQHITLLLEMTTRSNQLSDRAGDMAQIVSLSLNDTYSSGDYYNSIYPSFGGFVEALTGDYAVYLNKPSAYDGDYIMCAIRPSTNVKDQNAHLSCVSVLYSREKTN